ncbi:ComEA family DNA-binding protein [Fodinicola feengrottensis]|uniref:Helix-hairpin-helix DNA-binding motif class 1 domain-containing protein n=2 Tax=Fodinicola feengrottensis TaxID=435914 RepID=A0ABP4V609_9ACTN|nr:ComEA family DNA-binding protein [Fodinicola feengrottensis]
MLLPSVLRGALIDPGRRGLLAVAAVGIVAALVAGWLAWRARPVAEPVGAQVSAVRVVPSVASAAASAAIVVVAVGGKVRRPGLVRLPAGSRVADAVAAAGGALPGVDLTSVNLARKLVDGEQVVVGEPMPAAPGQPAATAGGVINLNAATAAELDALPGVGPVLAQRIVDYRTQHGPFSSVEQLREVSGIGAAKFANLRARVTV